MVDVIVAPSDAVFAKRVNTGGYILANSEFIQWSGGGGVDVRTLWHGYGLCNRVVCGDMTQDLCAVASQFGQVIVFGRNTARVMQIFDGVLYKDIAFMHTRSSGVGLIGRNADNRLIFVVINRGDNMIQRYTYPYDRVTHMSVNISSVVVIVTHSRSINVLNFSDVNNVDDVSEWLVDDDVICANMSDNANYVVTLTQTYIYVHTVVGALLWRINVAEGGGRQFDRVKLRGDCVVAWGTTPMITLYSKYTYNTHKIRLNTESARSICDVIVHPSAFGKQYQLDDVSVTSLATIRNLRRLINTLEVKHRLVIIILMTSGRVASHTASDVITRYLDGVRIVTDGTG